MLMLLDVMFGERHLLRNAVQKIQMLGRTNIGPTTSRDVTPDLKTQPQIPSARFIHQTIDSQRTGPSQGSPKDGCPRTNPQKLYRQWRRLALSADKTPQRCAQQRSPFHGLRVWDNVHAGLPKEGLRRRFGASHDLTPMDGHVRTETTLLNIR